MKTSYLVIFFVLFVSSASAYEEELLEAPILPANVADQIDRVVNFLINVMPQERVPHLGKCQRVLGDVVTLFQQGIGNIAQYGTANLSTSLTLIGTAMSGFRNMSVYCGLADNEVFALLHEVQSNLTSHFGQSLGIEVVNIVFRIKELNNLWKNLQFNLQNSSSGAVIGNIAAKIVDTIFAIDPRLELAINRLFTNTTRGGNIFQCMAQVTTTYNTANKTWNDYKNNPNMEMADLIDNIIVVSVDLPTTVRICLAALKSMAPPNSQTEELLLSSNPKEEVELNLGKLLGRIGERRIPVLSKFGKEKHKY